jgi:hypothetical protein
LHGSAQLYWDSSYYLYQAYMKLHLLTKISSRFLNLLTSEMETQAQKEKQRIEQRRHPVIILETRLIN